MPAAAGKSTAKAAGEGTKNASAAELKAVVKTEPPSPTMSSVAGVSNDKRKRPATDATDSSSSVVEKRRKDDGSNSSMLFFVYSLSSFFAALSSKCNIDSPPPIS